MRERLAHVCGADDREKRRHRECFEEDRRVARAKARGDGPGASLAESGESPDLKVGELGRPALGAILGEQSDRPCAIGRRDDAHEERGVLGKDRLERRSVQHAHRLDENVDRAAAREPDGEGELVADPIVHDARMVIAQHGHGLLVHGGFDATVAHGARDLLPGSRDQRRTEGTRCGSGDADDGRDRHGVTGGEPLRELGRDLFHRVAASAAAGSLRKRRRHPSPQK